MMMQHKIMISIFFWALVLSMGISYIITGAILNGRIEERKKGENIGYVIGWESGSNACYTNKFK